MLEVVAVIPDVPSCSGRSLEVVEVVSDVLGGSGRSLEVVAVVQTSPAAVEGCW